MTGRAYSLPSEAEWEKGARGTDGRIYPWGSQWDDTRCNSEASGLGQTTSVQAYPQGASSYGLLDMAGNVWEWPRSLWGKYPYPTDQRERTPRENLNAPRTTDRVLRGGAFDRYRWPVRCAYRDWNLPLARLRHLGFRVVVFPAS